jgi:hypothetical protein
MTFPEKGFNPKNPTLSREKNEGMAKHRRQVRRCAAGYATSCRLNIRAFLCEPLGLSLAERRAMPVIAIENLPAISLLQAYRDRRAYTDCFYIDLRDTLTLSDYIEAFYTNWLFKLERLVLATLVAKASTDIQAAALAQGERTKFAAWTVETRTEDQIVMRDYQSKTSSWLMCAPQDDGTTRLYFGSAIVPARIRPDGSVDLGAGFNQLVGAHRLYSVALLKATAARLRSRSAARR